MLAQPQTRLGTAGVGLGGEQEPRGPGWAGPFRPGYLPLASPGPPPPGAAVGVGVGGRRLDLIGLLSQRGLPSPHPRPPCPALPGKGQASEGRGELWTLLSQSRGHGSRSPEQP